MISISMIAMGIICSLFLVAEGKWWHVFFVIIGILLLLAIAFFSLIGII